MFDKEWFCPACSELFYHQPPNGASRHHASGLELKECAEARTCKLCSFLWYRCSPEQQQGMLSATSIDDDEDSHIECRLGDSNNLTFVLPSSAGDAESDIPWYRRPQVEFKFRKSALGSFSLDVVSKLRKDVDKTFNRRTAEHAKQWIAECKKHKHSQYASHKHSLPTRLVEVGTEQQPVLRLRISSTLPSTTTYVTLSHRWRQNPGLLLTVDNINDLMHSIPNEKLSKTFEDAITATRMMSVEYIWIDSLCIIQKAEEDWRREASRLADYYELSYCTLSASAMTDYGEDAGMILDRNNDLVQPLVLDIRPPSLPEATKPSLGSKVRRFAASLVPTGPKPDNYLLDVGSYYYMDTGYWGREVTKSTLNSRAWIYQERLLSPRTLHFGLTRTYFECSQEQYSDMQPFGVDKDMVADVDFKNLAPQTILMKLATDDDTISKYITHIWVSLVAQYSTHRLTFVTDRLAALAGTAKRFDDIFIASRRIWHAESASIQCAQPGQDVPKYFLGVWLPDHQSAIASLCWSVHGDLETRPKLEVPTWSFGSVASSIEFGSLTLATSQPDVEDLAKLVKVDADFDAQDESAVEAAMWTGRVKAGSGALWLVGALLPAKLETEHLVVRKGADQKEEDRNFTELGTWPGNPLLSVNGKVLRWAFSADELRQPQPPDSAQPSEDVQASSVKYWNGEYFAIPLSCDKREGVLYGLVLEWVAGPGNGVYRRVSSMSLRNDRGGFDTLLAVKGSDVVESLEQVLKMYEHERMDARFYESQETDGKYCIKVI